MTTQRRKLQLSHLQLTQTELMGQDYDVEEIKLQVRGVVGIDLEEAITDATIERTIEGASTLTLNIIDRDYMLLRSGRLSKKADVEIDGLWFRLVSVNKTGHLLDLVFEDREIAVLRTYNKVIKATAKTARYQMTRARFILRLIKEVKEFKIPWVIPELDVVQPVEEGGPATPTFNVANTPLGRSQQQNAQGGRGIPHGAGHKRVYVPTQGPAEPHVQRVIQGLTVKHVPMTDKQIDIANRVLAVGVSLGCSRPLLVMGMMCAIQESDMSNQPEGFDRWSDHAAGVFQEIPGHPDRMNVEAESRRFFTALKSVHHQHPSEPYYQQIEDVQRSGLPLLYAPWRHEAENIVTVYGIGATSGDNAQAAAVADTPPSTDYEFYRGKPKTVGKVTTYGKESSWACIQRLADEVNWRAFFVSGTFYYMDEHDLFQARPAALIDEDTDGVISIDGEFDVGKTSSDLTVTCYMGLWACPPGSTLQVVNMGVFNGKWLVSDVTRSLFSPIGEITLKKPRPQLPEPLGDNVIDPNSFSVLTGNNTAPTEPHETPGFGAPTPLRDAIMKGAHAVQNKGIHYDKYEPGRSIGVVNHIRLPRTPPTADCSSFVTWCYWQAHAPDPNNENYNWVGNTTTMYDNIHGKHISLHKAQPGDVVLYGDMSAGGDAAHAALYMGNGKVISVGGDPDPTVSDIDYRSDRKAIVNYLGDVPTN